MLTAGVIAETGVPNAAETGFLAGSNTFTLASEGEISNNHNYFTGSAFTKLRLFNQAAVEGMVQVKA